MSEQLRKLLRRLLFFLEHDVNIVKPSDPFSISKGSFRKHLPLKPVIIDCGSHNGSDAIDLSKIFPGATIHCFEPIPEIFTQLVENTRFHPNIHCYQIALSDRDGRADTYVSSEGSDGSSSLLEPLDHLLDHPQVRFKKNLLVETLKLDSWAKIYNVKTVDLLWLDMQGYEYQMLQASSLLFPTIKLIHTEVSTRNTYKGVVVYKEFKAWLEANNFRMIKEAIPAESDMGNVLFLKNFG